MADGAGQASNELENLGLAQPCTVEAGDCIVEITELEGYVRRLERSAQSAPGSLCSTDDEDAAPTFGIHTFIPSLSDPGSRPYQPASGVEQSSRPSVLKGNAKFQTEELQLSSKCSTCNDVDILSCEAHEPTFKVTETCGSNVPAVANVVSSATFDITVAKWMKSLRNTMQQRFGRSGMYGDTPCSTRYERQCESACVSDAASSHLYVT